MGKIDPSKMQEMMNDEEIKNYLNLKMPSLNKNKIFAFYCANNIYNLVMDIEKSRIFCLGAKQQKLLK